MLAPHLKDSECGRVTVLSSCSEDQTEVGSARHCKPLEVVWLSRCRSRRELRPVGIASGLSFCSWGMRGDTLIMIPTAVYSILELGLSLDLSR